MGTGTILPDLIYRSARARPDHPALVLKGGKKSYAVLAAEVTAFAKGFVELGLRPSERVGIFLEKQFETVTALLGANAAGGVFVPINPVLRPGQVAHILNDCSVRALVTTRKRAAELSEILPSCSDLKFLILLEDGPAADFPTLQVENWDRFLQQGAQSSATLPTIAEDDLAGILYTSGSTGNPKGVVLTHRNFVLCASTVADYLKYRPDDRILNLPPYSFGFGLSQLFTSLHAGVTAVLHSFLTAQDLLEVIAAERVTGVSGVPTAMSQVAALPWPPEAEESIRYISVAGGRMPESATMRLRAAHPQVEVYLMYGMTETLRATYLAPDEADRRPTSIGKAIPNAEILILRPDGTPCDVGETGELVQKGPLLARGYWNDPARSADVFRPIPGDSEPAVWSGDMVKQDADGFIYFVGRRDEIVKIRGYRTSPVEIEDVVMASGQAAMAAAICVARSETEQSLFVYVTPKNGAAPDIDAILTHCRNHLPAYLVPQGIITRDRLPLTPNGKLERKKLLAEHLASEEAAAALPQSAFELSTEPSFLQRFKTEFLHLLGVQRRTFRSVMAIYRWNFPGRQVDRRDTFLTLEGDSLSYVSVSTGIEEYLGSLPRGWESLPIEELQKMQSARSSLMHLQPDIAMRAVALICILAVHAGNRFVSGSSMLLLILSGLSFARFNWSNDGRKVCESILRLAIKIAIPTWIMLSAIFAYRHEINWGVLFFYDNLIHPIRVTWWLPAWYLQVLLQIFAAMGLVSLIPGIAAFVNSRRYLAGMVFFWASVGAYVAFALLASPHWLDFDSLPVYFAWLFAFGWLVAAAHTPGQKLASYLSLLAGLTIIVTMAARVGDFSLREHGRYWLILAVPILLWAPTFFVPRVIGSIAGLLAQATLFIYLFHWPLADIYKIAFRMDTAFGAHNSPLRFVVGFLTSILLWILWESTWRALRLERLTASLAIGRTKNSNAHDASRNVA